MTQVPDMLETQVGLETPWGTAVAPTAKIMGLEKFSIKPLIAAKRLVDQRGSKAPGHVSEIASIDGEGSFDGWLSYEEIHYFLEAMVGTVTPSGAGPYIFAGAAPGTTPESGRPQTFVHGGPNGAYALVGGVGQSLNIAIATAMEGRFSGSLIGKRGAVDALEALSDREVHPVMGDHAKIYIDAWAGTMGATEMANLAFSAELAIEATRKAQHRLSALDPKGIAGDKWQGSLKMVMEFDDTTIKGFMDTILATSPAVWKKQVRIELSNSTELLDLDFAGFQEEAPEIFTDEDGISTVEFNLLGEYNSALGNWFAYSGSIATATLP